MKNYALSDAKLARDYGIDPNDKHAPYTLSMSGVTICWECSAKKAKSRKWWQWFKNMQVRWPCDIAKGL